MAGTIEGLVRSTELLQEIRSAGIALVVSGDEGGVLLQTEPPPRSDWPVLKAQVKCLHWWEPESMDHATRLASRLAAELKMRWDQWVAGV